MSQGNVEVVKLAYEAFASEGLDGFMEHFTDDVEYDVLAGADDLIHGPCHGKDAVGSPGFMASDAPELRQ